MRPMTWTRPAPAYLYAVGSANAIMRNAEKTAINFLPCFWRNRYMAVASCRCSGPGFQACQRRLGFACGRIGGILSGELIVEQPRRLAIIELFLDLCGLEHR